MIILAAPTAKAARHAGAFDLLRQQDEQVPACSLNHSINNSHSRGLTQPCS